MPIIEYYNKNGKLLSTRDEILNESNIDWYVEEHDLPKTEAYIEATKDIVAKINAIVYGNVEKRHYNSPAAVTRLLREFLIERESFLQHCDTKFNPPKNDLTST